MVAKGVVAYSKGKHGGQRPVANLVWEAILPDSKGEIVSAVLPDVEGDGSIGRGPSRVPGKEAVKESRLVDEEVLLGVTDPLQLNAGHRGTHGIEEGEVAESDGH